LKERAFLFLISIEETNGVVKGNHVIKEMEQKGKSLMIRLSK
jgi:hypothetical protein